MWVLLLGSSLFAGVMMSFLISSYEKFANQSTRHGTDSMLKANEPESFSSLLGSFTMYIIDVLTNHGISNDTFEFNRYLLRFSGTAGDYHLKYTYIASFTIFLAFWLLGISVLIFSYTSIVVSSLTSPRMKPSINSYEDLANSQEVALILRTDLVPMKRILVCFTDYRR